MFQTGIPHTLPCLSEKPIEEIDMPTLLIVRPAAQAAADMHACTAAGWRGVPFPVMDIVPDETALSALPVQYGRADAVFWVSPGAVQTGMRTLDFGRFPAKPNIAVGKAGMAALRRAGCTDTYAPEHGNDSENVLQMPVWQTLHKNARVLIVRGKGGRGLLAASLSGRGMQVEFAEIYGRMPKKPDWPVFEAFAPDAVWLVSAESAALFFGQMPAGLVQQAKSLLYFTHHPRIAAALRAQGAVRVELIEKLDAPTLNRYTEQTDER